MHRVLFNPRKLTGRKKKEWQEWLEKAEAATERIIKAWEDWRQQGSPGSFTFEFEEKVWGELKEWLVRNVFHDKCAYCETREARSPYHAEHFRPKGRVRFRVNGRKRLQTGKAVDEMGQEVEHPGYFWLAYNWLNLLPSCNYCNSARGKNDQFPVSRSHTSVRRLTAADVAQLRQPEIRSSTRNDVYYLQPPFLNDLEEPLLLHPYLDDPGEHLIFGEFGIVAAREDKRTGQPSLKGLTSIEVYDLDSDSLRAARQREQEAASMTYGNEYLRGRGLSRKAKLEAAKQAIASYINHEEPYSAAVLDYLKIMFPDHNL